MSGLPSNVHLSQHPCLLAKLSQLRSQSTPARDVKTLIHDIALILGCEALGKTLGSTPGPKVRSSRRRAPSPIPPLRLPLTKPNLRVSSG